MIRKSPAFRRKVLYRTVRAQYEAVPMRDGLDPAVRARVVLLRQGYSDAEIDAKAPLPASLREGTLPGSGRERRAPRETAHRRARAAPAEAPRGRPPTFWEIKARQRLKRLRAHAAAIRARGEPVTIPILARAAGLRRAALYELLNRGSLAPYRAELIDRNGHGSRPRR